jgi:hypothetical protein
VETTRNLEIENIVLRDALRDCGVDTSLQGGDMLLRVEKGPSGYFVADAKVEMSEVEKPYLKWLQDWWYEDAYEPNSDRASAPPALKPDTAENGDASSVDVRLGEALEALCRQNPERAFDLAVESLGRSAAMMNEIVEETRHDLIEFEIRRKQIDRTQARTREILSELFGETK